MRLAGARGAWNWHALVGLVAWGGLAVGSWIGAVGLLADDRKPLDHEAYDQWKSVSARELSPDGKWLSYQTSQGWSDSEVRKLYVRSTESDVEYRIDRGRSATFDRAGAHLLMIVDPDPAAVKKAVADKLPEDQRPQPSLSILSLVDGRVRTVPGVRSYSVPEKGSDWVAYVIPQRGTTNVTAQRGQVDKELVPRQNAAGVTTLVKLLAPAAQGNPTSGSNPAAGAKAANAAGSSETAGPTSSAAGTGGATNAGAAGSSGGGRGAAGRGGRGRGGDSGNGAGNELVIEQLSTGRQWRFLGVTEFRFDKFGRNLSWMVEGDEGQRGVWLTALSEPIHPQRVHDLAGKYAGLAWDEAGQQLAFSHQGVADEKSKEPATATVYLYRRDATDGVATVATAGTAGVPEGWLVQPETPLSFSKSGQRLFFNTTPKLPIEPEADGPANSSGPPTAKLDLWHWSEPLLQTVQQVQVNRLRRLSYRAVYHIESQKVVQLARPETPTVVIADEDNSAYGVMVTNEPYQVERTWEAPGFADVWLVDVRSGKREKVLERTASSVQISPSGQYLYWWDGRERHWYSMSTRTKETIKISESVPQALVDEEHDTPNLPPAYGLAGWAEKDKFVWVYDRYDLWQLDPAGKQAPQCLTDGQGRQQQVRLRRVRLDREERFVPLAGAHYLSAFAERSKSSGFYELRLGKEQGLKELILLPESVGDLVKAEQGETVLVTRQDFRSFPDHWKTDLTFSRFQRLTKINPQQNDYHWGTAEPMEWTSATGRRLEGIVYKPELFNPNGKYPLLVYYYERNSENLHRYYPPAAGRSTINISFYVSRGYVVFVPDIVYETGSPGQSAMNCVMPGVDKLVAQGYIDPQRMGLQGHSWGGYQTAYIVSQTDRFAAAEAGAPVSNMTSAYGGIRWESGLSRMFQYERTQSRIGRTLWEDRQAYIDNSPLFFADRIRTPLLILHNDNDGAVPWYQGIELFMALRRLERPAWLVNYNGEPHGISKEENRRDFAVRMQQFFDHYLQGAPAAEWMVRGIPATEKGQSLGLELVPESVGSEDR